MIGTLGQGALYLLLVVVPYAFIASILSARRHDNLKLSVLAKLGTVLQFVLTLVASLCLLTLLITLNFHYAYVADYTSRGLELVYRIAAFWGGNAGSLLFWLLITSLYALVVRFTRHEGSEKLLPVVSAIMSFVIFFFVIVLNFFASPFVTLPHPPINGNGLNALLQNPGMTVHPVNLYLGYVGFLVPFAYGMAALILKKSDAAWLRATRKWTLISWLFLSCGIIYGAHWSYEELGWGGYWSWDPIENAALMPWLAATAFLHSAIIQERKNMFKFWNVILISLTYLLTLFGTALTRGGLLWSIHAFANGEMGTVFLTFVGIMFVLAVGLITWHAPVLRSSTRFESAVSKESGFLFNNVLFIGILFAVFWGTVFPLVSEAVTGNSMMVSGSFYNAVVLPISVVLILWMGVGPVLAWRKASLSKTLKLLRLPALAALILGVILRIFAYQGALSYFTLVVAFFVLVVILQEFLAGVQARSEITKEGFGISLWRLVAKNRRRYGGYIVHIAVLVMVIGFAGSGGYAKQQTISLKPGQTVRLGNYDFEYHGLNTSHQPGQVLLIGSLLVTNARTGHLFGVLQPSVSFFENGDSPSTNIGLYSTSFTDLYAVLDGADYNTGQALFEIHINPLVSFIWYGGYLYIVGTLIGLWPERRRRLTESEDVSEEEKDLLYKDLRDLEYDWHMGKITEAEYRALRSEKLVTVKKLQDTSLSGHDLEQAVEIELQGILARRREATP